MNSRNTKQMFRFQKPPTWPYLPLFEKLKLYKDTLNGSYAPYVDKLEAKRIVKEMCGDQIQVAKLVRVLSGPDDITEEDMNPAWMIKSSHGCGWNININETTTVEECKAKLRSWNKVYVSGAGEPQYSYIQPRFYIEEKVPDIRFGINGEALLYRFHCIKGKPVVASVSNNKLQSNYDMNWKQIEQCIISPNLPYPVEKPACYQELVELAKILSAPFEFVRVDFYLGTDGIYFSEWTFSPAGGNRRFSFSLEKKLGALWT
jgi:hypothetical protein